jgi:hypothetical protein
MLVVICLFLIPIPLHPRSMRDSLAKHRSKHSNKVHFDLSQSVSRARTTLQNGELPCLATSTTFLWSESLGRTFSGHEKLRSLLYPVDRVDLSEYSETVLTRFAGNGMFIPSVGWSLLCHLLSLEAK